MRNILVVDDDCELLDIFVRELANADADWNVVGVTQGEAARLALHATEMDLMITDIHMPDQNGLSLILDARAIRPDIRVIAMSGQRDFGGMDLFEWAESFGSAAMIEKPFRLADFVETVRGALDAPATV